MLRTKIIAVIAISIVVVGVIGITAYVLLNKPEAAKNTPTQTRPYTSNYTSYFSSPYHQACPRVNREKVDIEKSYIYTYDGQIQQSETHIKTITSNWIRPNGPYPADGRRGLNLYIFARDRKDNPINCAKFEIIKDGEKSITDAVKITTFSPYATGQEYFTHNNGMGWVYVSSVKAGTVYLKIKINNKELPDKYRVNFE